MPIPFVDLSAQYQSIRDKVDRAMLDVVASSQFILGEQVRFFEKEFAAYCGVQYAIGVDSGTSALELALRAMGIGPEDEVITAANTFIATVLAIMATGAKPVLADVEPMAYNISIDGIEAAITPRTRAIMPVHLYGQPADMGPIMELARQYGLAVLEDACQAHGAYYKDRSVGSIGDAAAFSFYPAKNLGCYGDGGIVVTNSKHIAESVRMFRNYGQREKYVHLLKGYNHRLDTLQAAVLRVKLPYLDEWNDARRNHAQQYEHLLAGNGLVLPVEAEYAKHVYHLYVVRTTRRGELLAYLMDQGISTGIHYPVPIHLQAACKDLGYKAGDLPVSEECAAQVLSLPMYAELAPEQISEVAECIMDFAAG
jgi:dTDP-4-amino-4,6-dideoxygalactose transaminase